MVVSEFQHLCQCGGCDLQVWGVVLGNPRQLHRVEPLWMREVAGSTPKPVLMLGNPVTVVARFRRNESEGCHSLGCPCPVERV